MDFIHGDIHGRSCKNYQLLNLTTVYLSRPMELPTCARLYVLFVQIVNATNLQ